MVLMMMVMMMMVLMMVMMIIMMMVKMLMVRMMMMVMIMMMMVRMLMVRMLMVVTMMMMVTMCGAECVIMPGQTRCVFTYMAMNMVITVNKLSSDIRFWVEANKSAGPLLVGGPRGGLTLVAPCGLLGLRLRHNGPVCGCDGGVKMSGVGSAVLASRG
ncbi:hypothetical protein ACOMHN_036674 [Nucella lapillus]